MSNKQTDGVRIREGDVLFEFTFEEFDCIVGAIAEKLQATRNGVREAILFGKLPLSDILEEIDSCTLEFYKQKRRETAIETAIGMKKSE